MEVGSSHDLIIAQGFRRIGEGWGLIGHDGSLRLFAELTADPDRPEVRPREAYRALLASLGSGWTVRLLQIFWPDPVPRGAFTEHVQGWDGGGGEGEGFKLLHQSLLVFTQEAPLPFTRRTFLEFLSPGEEGAAWWEALPGLLGAYGVQVEPLAPEEIQELARWIFNPELE
ncbi:MAG: hypothetical protein PVG14_00160 [Anaerolineales bacterium]|jgi:hypothetical protein